MVFSQDAKRILPSLIKIGILNLLKSIFKRNKTQKLQRIQHKGRKAYNMRYIMWYKLYVP